MINTSRLFIFSFPIAVIIDGVIGFADSVRISIDTKKKASPADIMEYIVSGAVMGLVWPLWITAFSVKFSHDKLVNLFQK